MNVYRGRPCCSLCGSLRMANAIHDHNLACANYGERSYSAGTTTRFDRPLTAHETRSLFRTPSMQFKPFYGRRVSHQGQA